MCACFDCPSINRLSVSVLLFVLISCPSNFAFLFFLPYTLIVLRLALFFIVYFDILRGMPLFPWIHQHQFGNTQRLTNLLTNYTPQPTGFYVRFLFPSNLERQSIVVFANRRHHRTGCGRRFCRKNLGARHFFC